MIFNNFTLRHTVIYLGGIICLVVLNIYQLHQFQASVIAESERWDNAVYQFMESYECESRTIRDVADNDEYYKKLNASHSVKQSEAPCTALNYYLLGEGFFYLALIPLFLILFPFFPGSSANQRIYNRTFYLSLAIVVFMLLNIFLWYDYNLESGSQSGFTRVGSYEIFFCVTPVLYLCFLLFGWGRHRENRFKFLLLTICLLAVIPLFVLYGLARIF